MQPSAGLNLLDNLPGDFASRPDVIADGASSLGGGELIARVARLADTIITLGGNRVALLADNGIPWIIADLACQVAGVALLPIPTFFTPAQIHHAVTEAGIDLFLLDQGRNWPLLELTSATSPWSEHPVEVEGLDLYRRHHHADDGAQGLPAGTGKITYTSGSTGTPKGVCLSNTQLIRQATALAAAVALPGSRHLCLLPLSVLLENVAGVYTALINGGTVMVPPLSAVGFSGSSSLDTEKLLAALHQFAPQTLILLPQLLTVLVQACETGWQPPASLRFIAVGGSKVSPGLVDRARRYGLPVYEGYGLSECASVVSLNTPAQDRAGSVGKPLSHLYVYGHDGEVVIVGNPFLGYVNDPVSWHQEHVASGDLGRLDRDGFLFLQGRKKNLLISSFGRNISPEWVESELTAGPLLQDVVVFGDSKPWLSALIYPRRPEISDNDIEALIQRVNATLPDYARIGRWSRLEKPLATVPGLTTATGKPRRDAIYNHFQAAIEQLYSPVAGNACSEDNFSKPNYSKAIFSKESPNE